MARVAGLLAERGAHIVDTQSNQFAMLVAFTPGEAGSIDRLCAEFAPIADAARMLWALRGQATPKRVLPMVSKWDHCLLDLLYRNRPGELPMKVVAIASNHPRDMLHASLIDDIPFHHLPVTRDTKAAQEARIKQLIDDTGAELLVLARYMQILSDDLAAFLSGRSSTSVTASCPGSRARNPVIRPMS